MIPVLLLFQLVSKHVHGMVEVDGTGERYPSRAASFGPSISGDGLDASLIPIEFMDGNGSPYGCLPISRTTHHQIGNNPRWIAMVERGGGCSFLEKVRAMQASGAAGVVVGDDQPGSTTLVKMTVADGEDTQDVAIPSVFILQWEYKDLKMEAMRRLLTSTDKFHAKLPVLPVTIYSDQFIDLPISDLLLLLLITPALILLLLYLIYRIRTGDDLEGLLDMGPARYIQSLRERPATLEMVEAIPKKIFSEKDSGGEDELLLQPFSVQDTCAICLDMFVDGDELRHLPCYHDFHTECIDPWLLERKRTCPLCKRDACSAQQPFIPSTLISRLPTITERRLRLHSPVPSSSSDDSFMTAQTYQSSASSLIDRIWPYAPVPLDDIELARAASPRSAIRSNV